MNIKKEILEFMNERPDAIGIIGYGSGVNPQKGQEKRKPQIDLIVIVDDLKQWHKKNIKINRKDYSFTSRLFFKYAPYKWLKSGAKICYMTYIPFKNQEYKIGTIEINDFLNDLNNWETFYMAGRMQKPILVVKDNKQIDEAINYNRISGINAVYLLIDKNKLNINNFYITLASLSYMGDTRMAIAENPDKVKNIVSGSIDFYNNIYKPNLKLSADDVLINHNVVMKNLPKNLHEYLLDHTKIKNKINVTNFLIQKNKSQSLAQTIKGIFTTGPIKAIKYAFEKLKRKRGK